VKRLLLALVLALGVAPAFAGAGAVPGPVSRSHSVQGFHNVAYKVTFAAGAPATIRVTGDGDTRLSLVVFDANGRRVTSDTRANDVLSVRFTPARQQTYQVRVYNKGGVPNRFSLKTN
jgi:hypothetical protein